MSGFECFTDVLCDIESFFYRNRPSRNSVGKRLAFHKFKHEIPRTVCLLKIVDRSDVGMV
jgi:hypothetical protein